MAVINFRVADVRAKNGRPLGVGPSYQGFIPLPVPGVQLSGVTRDSTGAALGFCTVKIFRTVDDSLAGQTVSDANGNWSFSVNPLWSYYTVEYKPSITLAALGATAQIFAAQITPSIPPAAQAGDILVCVTDMNDSQVVTYPAGWTKEAEVSLFAGGQGIDVAVSVGWRRMVAGDANPTLTWGLNSQMSATITAFRGAAATGDPFDAFSTGSTDATALPVLDGTATAPSITPTGACSMILLVGAVTAGRAQITGYSGSKPELVQAFNVQVADLSSRVGLAYGTKSDATPTGDRIVSFGGPNVVNLDTMVCVLLSMKPASVDLFGSSSNKLVGA
jgi:hypothetical protein